MKTSPRQAVAGDPAEGASAPNQHGVGGIDSARRRLDEAIAKLERETLSRIAEVRAQAAGEANAKVTALETEIAKLKAEKRALERSNADLRKAAESAGARVERALGEVRAVLGESAGG